MGKNKDELSPMMKQYKIIKAEYSDKILMFRLGDFYEMFYDDAITASRELDLTLTSRACGNGARAPMCGVPHHAVQAYITRLLKKGYKVAICEQMQDPAQADGMIARSVTRIITGGTITDPESLSGDKNNYLMSLYADDKGVGAVWADITTSETYNHFIPYPVKVKLNDLLLRIKPAEIICNSKMLAESVELSAIKYGSVCQMTQCDDRKPRRHFRSRDSKAYSFGGAERTRNKRAVQNSAVRLRRGRARIVRSKHAVQKRRQYRQRRKVRIDSVYGHRRQFRKDARAAWVAKPQARHYASRRTQ